MGGLCSVRSNKRAIRTGTATISESHLCEGTAIVVDTCASLAEAPCNAKYEQDKLKRTCKHIRRERGPICAWLKRQGVDENGAAGHLQAHHGNAQAAHELGACGVKDLWKILASGKKGR